MRGIKFGGVLRGLPAQFVRLEVRARQNRGGEKGKVRDAESRAQRFSQQSLPNSVCFEQGGKNPVSFPNVT